MRLAAKATLSRAGARSYKKPDTLAPSSLWEASLVLWEAVLALWMATIIMWMVVLTLWEAAPAAE
ncbi:hypothetical protein B9Z31_02115 [Limnohabitans sp. G3-2]|nr:hypothetical protein B9Z31_02115 [Limnohabitans sp. G3-2]